MNEHLDWPTLVDYWLGDTDEPATDAIELHLMSCDACGETFDEIAALAQGVREAFSSGRIASFVSAGFVERLKAAGRRVREYRVPAGGSVTCSVTPEDEMLISRIAAPLGGVRRLDAVIIASFAPGHEERLSDLPFDPDAGEVVFAPRLAEVRRQPSHELVVRLLAVEDAGEREIGRYTFVHQGQG